MPEISSLHIYIEPRHRVVDFNEVAAYARERLNLSEIVLRGPLAECSIDGEGPLGRRVPAADIAGKMAVARVKNLEAPLNGSGPALYGEIDYETRRLKDRSKQVFGVLYDAHLLAQMYSGLIPENESTIDCLNVIFTNQLIGTWDEGDNRYHARTVLCGSPSIVSLSGIVEAPAKSREYYLARRSAEAFGMAEEEKMELAGSFAEDCLSHDDVRLTEAAKGFLMQAVAYRITGEPFCKDRTCRLFNAHWQKELLACQFGEKDEFCSEHRQIFQRCSDRDGETLWI